MNFIWRAWRPYDAVLGEVDGLNGYHDVTRYPAARRVPGLVLFRWDAPLFFANAEVFGQDVREAVAAGVELHFAEVKDPVKDPVKDRLRRYGLLEELGPERFHPTVGSAVDAYVAETSVAWREEDVEPNADPEGR